MKKSFPRIPDSELEIMLVLWNGHEDMSRSEIEAELNTKKNWAPTTINTLLSRLEQKSFLSVTKQGKTNLYTPMITQEEYLGQESHTILQTLFNNSLENFVTALYHGKKIDSEKLQELDSFLKDLEEEEDSSK